VEAAGQQDKPSAPATEEPGKDSAEQAAAPEPETQGADEKVQPDKEAAAQEPQIPKGVQDRIDKLTRLRREAEEREAAIRAENEDLKRRVEAATKTTTGKAEPKLEEFETHEEWQKALIDYRLEQKDLERLKRETEERATRTKVAREAKAGEVGKAGIERYKDFGEKCFRLPIGDEFLEDLFTIDFNFQWPVLQIDQLTQSGKQVTGQTS
jgi:hypothetical protein